MGLDIGFNAYKKVGDNKFKRVALSDSLFTSWRCGRNDLNYKWGDYFDDNGGSNITFDVEFEGNALVGIEGDDDTVVLTTPDVDNGEYPLTYCDFDGFVNNIEDAIVVAEAKNNEARNSIKASLANAQKELDTLLRLQMMSDSTTAYNNAKQMVADARATIASYQDELDDDWDADAIAGMKRLVLSMKQIYSLGFIVIPYFSY